MICYYSNFCEPSKQLLQKIARTKLKQEIHFICIDQRKQINGQTFIFLENEKVILPPQVNKVPALYMIETKRVLFENDIYNHLLPKEVSINEVETNGNGEPECYSLNQMSQMSDAYSFLDQAPEELSTKGQGGMRQLHNFVPLEQSYSIHTPSEDYVPDKIGKTGKSLEDYKNERDSMVSQPIKRV